MQFGARSRSTFKAVQSSHFMVHEYRLASYANKDDYTITGLCYALLDITELLLHKKEVDICAQVSNLWCALITSLSGHQTINLQDPISLY